MALHRMLSGFNRHLVLHSGPAHWRCCNCWTVPDPQVRSAMPRRRALAVDDQRLIQHGSWLSILSGRMLTLPASSGTLVEERDGTSDQTTLPTADLCRTFPLLIVQQGVMVGSAGLRAPLR